MTNRFEDTIVAVATPPGEGGIGIVRISGVRALEIGRSLFSFSGGCPEIESHRMYAGKVVLLADGGLGTGLGQQLGRGAIDQGLFVFMKAPRSFSGEDTVEIQCHGSPILLETVVNGALSCGARTADRGEFTRRAFMNGRIDLTQAEAVADLIAARTVDSMTASARHLFGGLSEKIRVIRDTLIPLLSRIEASIDFSDQDLEAPPQGKIAEQLESILSVVRRLTATYPTGRVYREGVRLVIVGRPNVGKSSLMNALIGRPRAIVTPEPGTTRDTVEETMSIGGFPARLVDTCGLGEAGGPVEREGMKRTREALSDADVILLVGEAAAGIGERERQIIDARTRESGSSPRALVVVMNKVDLVAGNSAAPFDAGGDFPTVFTSALMGTGIDRLKDEIASLIAGGAGSARDEVMVTNSRHYEALLRASDSLSEAIGGVAKGVGPEFIAVDVRGALTALGEVTGEVTTGEVLEAIFSRFCIGK